MSRRKRESRPPAPPPTPAPAPSRPSAGGGLLGEVAILLAVLGVVTLIAELAGAANLGVAISIGAIAFTLALMYLIVVR